MVNKAEDALKTKRIEDVLSTVNKKVFNEKISYSLAQKVVQNRRENKI